MNHVTALNRAIAIQHGLVKEASDRATSQEKAAEALPPGPAKTRLNQLAYRTRKLLSPLLTHLHDLETELATPEPRGTWDGSFDFGSDEDATAESSDAWGVMAETHLVINHRR